MQLTLQLLAKLEFDLIHLQFDCLINCAPFKMFSEFSYLRLVGKFILLKCLEH